MIAVDETKVSQVLIMNGNLPSGPQIVFPFFRPISLYEIEDDYDNLVKEIKENHEDEEFLDQMVLYIDAFRVSLKEKSADPLIHYFLINAGGSVDVNQIQDVFDALDNFIEQATDENRPMH